MSNPRAWRGKGRTVTPNSRQKRNRLFLDAHGTCECCKARSSEEAHHRLPKGSAQRHDWRHMQALCVPCHVTVHQQLRLIFKSRRGS